MRLFSVEIKLEVMIKAEVSLLIPASPGLGPSSGFCYAFSIVESTIGTCGDQEAGLAKAQSLWPRLRLCALARKAKIMIPLNPSFDLLPPF